MSGGGASSSDEECEIAMGPMIDCVFLLLLYYISVSSLEATRMSGKVALPIAIAGIKEDNESGRFIVDIEWDEAQYTATFKCGPKTLNDPRDITPLIEKGKRMINSKLFRVVIRADKMVPYEFTQQVMAAIAEADVANIMFSTITHAY